MTRSERPLPLTSKLTEAMPSALEADASRRAVALERLAPPEGMSTAVVGGGGLFTFTVMGMLVSVLAVASVATLCSM